MPRMCTTSTCAQNNGQVFPALFTVMLEAPTGEPLGVADMCGPCAADQAYHMGSIVSGLPVAMANGRAVWPE